MRFIQELCPVLFRVFRVLKSFFILLFSGFRLLGLLRVSGLGFRVRGLWGPEAGNLRRGRWGLSRV